MNYLIKTSVFSLIGNYLRTSNNYRQLIFNINAVVLIDTVNLLRFTKLVKCSVVRLWDFHNRSSKIIGQVISINHRL